MWRFILISFGFLGFAFYQASGGSDYAPAPDSLQVAYAGKSLFSEPKVVPARVQMAAQLPKANLPKPETPTRRETAQVARTQAISAALQKSTTFTGLSGLSKDETGGFGITLASMTQPLNGGGAVDTRRTFNAETLVSDVRNVPIDEAVIASLAPEVSDIRRIAGNAANMRSGPGTDFEKVDQLTRGTSVEVLDRRGTWVELRDINTGQTGWMADWLVTAAN
jgi:hypothetical protein